MILRYANAHDKYCYGMYYLFLYNVSFEANFKRSNQGYRTYYGSIVLFFKNFFSLVTSDNRW